MSGWTLVSATGKCGRCAAHCNFCDEAGPGGCNECGKRRMLEVRLEVHGEVHECHACGDGCRACTMESGCTKCDSFYYLLPRGAGCAFSWLRMLLLVGSIIGGIGGCIYCAGGLEDEPPPRRRRAADMHAEVVTSDSRDGAELRRRSSKGNADAGGNGIVQPTGHSTWVDEPALRKEGAYPLLQGYSGIDVVDVGR